MAFDQTTRNRLQRFVSDARATLTEEFTRQLQNEYGLDPVSASVTPMERLPNLDDARRETARILRDTLEHYRQTSPSEDLGALLDRVVREHAFTVLNRLAALRMAEARGLLIESLSNGYNSKGFQLYSRLSGTGLGERGDAYRSYLFSLFDEFALDLRVLFDRFSPTGRLFPREAALLETLALMNDPEIAPLWAEDETIGWIYQYFNSKEERKKMRDDSAAPRNSRELAVRNQFFTPRYVVEFLTDNTLGRIWYEMTKGETRLIEQCRYLVIRPEIFLQPGEEADCSSDRVDDAHLSQEKLFKQPVYIPHRPLKDPREIRILDPACGSMHFGLYAFDLLEVIYEEAWECEEAGVAPSIERSSELKPLRESYADKQEFLRDVPRLIIEHNLHGIDIDPRAVQIAGLSLWLRAQRAWQYQGVKAATRPRIRRSNIVCAEPMPGEESLLNEFIDRHLSATPELRLIAQLTRRVFKAMKLAGEAGSLLRIEEEVAGAVVEAKEQWLAETKQEQGQSSLFADLAKHEQQRLGFEVAEITDETFWERAESSIYAALREYAEQADNGGGYQRRLFADDAARGFSFIDVCRKRYDVVLMNPPFGDSSEDCIKYLESHYSSWNANLLCAFLERAWEKTHEPGSVGAIYDRTAVIKSTYEDFRRTILIPDDRLAFMADLGWEVLDANVEVSASVVFHNHRNPCVFVDVRGIAPDLKGSVLLRQVETSCGVDRDANIKVIYGSSFKAYPNSVIGYDFPDFLHRAFAEGLSLRSSGYSAYTGHQFRTEQHFRLWWEISSTNPPVFQGRLFNGAGFSPFVTGLRDILISEAKLDRLPQNSFTNLRNREKHQLPGICFGKRGDYFCAYVLPTGHYFSLEGLSIPIPDLDHTLEILGVLDTPLARASLNKFAGQHKTSGYVNLFPYRQPLDPTAVKAKVKAAVIALIAAQRFDETLPYFYTVERQDSIAHLAGMITETIRLGLMRSFECESYCHESSLTSYGVSASDTAMLNTFRQGQPAVGAPIEDADLSNGCKWYSTHSLMSYLLGASVGRWDVLFAMGEKLAPELPDPFAPLPVCPPGMLQNERGLPAASSDVPSSYPLRISWPGTLIDDKGHTEDIERRVREALQVIWQDRADAIEQEACEILGVKTLRDYFGKPAGFFADHLKRYSKSRRQAPIYWPLSTRSGEYTLWLYYHRLNDQTLYTCVNNFVEPKLRQVSEAVNRLRGKGAGRTRDEEKEFERLQDFEQELQEFRDELLRLAKLPWRPNLNDGVQITAAPLWKLFSLPKWQKTLKETWQSLDKGDYDWAHLSMTVWPERVVPKCAKDRSLAIAHGAEDLFWVEDEERWRALRSPKEEIEEQKRWQRSEARERAKRLLCDLARDEYGHLSAADVGSRLAAGGYDDRELALLLYPQRMAEKCWEDVALARRLGLSHPAKKTKAARDKFIKEIVTRGCVEIALMVEAALDGRAKSFAEVWREIESGERDDLALALSLWPDRVVDKCAEDMALAEQHSLRKFFWVQYPAEAWRRRLSIEEEISNEIEWRRCIAAGLASTPSFQDIS